MKKIFILFLLLAIQNLWASDLYLKTFGNPANTPVLFLHGGPGYNASTFEVMVAKEMENAGFYVVVYDRRGEGRSGHLSAAYTFEETFSDIVMICDSLGLEKVNLLGHSFGGVVSTKFATKHPNRVAANVLIGAPVSLQDSFHTIIVSCRKIYKKKKDKGNLGSLTLLEMMDSASIEYSSYCFMHAMRNGFYATKKPTKDAKRIYAANKGNAILKEYAAQMDRESPTGFWRNEQYTTLDLSGDIKALKTANVPVYGLYGMEDGLYSSDQVEALQTILGTENLLYLKKCSHSVFIDQQTVFIATLKRWLN